MFYFDVINALGLCIRKVADEMAATQPAKLD